MKSKMMAVYGGYSVATDKIVGIFAIDTNPIRKQIKNIDEEGKLVDITKGKKMKSFILLENGYGIIVPIKQETLMLRYNKLDL